MRSWTIRLSEILSKEESLEEVPYRKLHRLDGGYSLRYRLLTIQTFKLSCVILKNYRMSTALFWKITVCLPHVFLPERHAAPHYFEKNTACKYRLCSFEMYAINFDTSYHRFNIILNDYMDKHQHKLLNHAAIKTSNCITICIVYYFELWNNNKVLCRYLNFSAVKSKVQTFTQYSNIIA